MSSEMSECITNSIWQLIVHNKTPEILLSDHLRCLDLGICIEREEGNSTLGFN
jgi:hypothetical protein